jgi:L-cysteine S-thiosulfotransferase
MMKSLSMPVLLIAVLVPWAGAQAEEAVDARALWEQVEGQAGKSCASCHTPVEETMAGRAATFPKFFEKAGREVTLEERINMCRKNALGADPWNPESAEMVALVEMLRSFE